MEEATAPAPRKPEDVVQALEQALQEEGLVIARETNLEVISHFLSTAKKGTLFVAMGEGEDTQTTEIDVLYGRTPMGEYILQWHSESIEDVMTNGRTHLITEKEDIFFTSVHELFFGDTKAFVVCVPFVEEHVSHQ